VRLLSLLDLDTLQLAGQLKLDVVDSRTHFAHQLLKPGLNKGVGILERHINWLLVEQVELWNGKSAQPKQNEKSERVEYASDQIAGVEEEHSQKWSEKVVPKNDRLGLVDQLVNVSLEPVRELINSLLGQSKIGGR